VTSAAYVTTTHAVERFRERVRPGLTWDAAERELAQLLRAGEAKPEAPSWLADVQRQRADLYLIVGDIVFPLAASEVRPGRWLVTTCIARGGLSGVARKRRNDRRRRRPLTTVPSRGYGRPSPRRIDLAAA
jgi:hypothetical protein